MEKYDKAKIEGTREYFKKENFQEVQETLEGRTFSYFIVPQSKSPDFPYFVIRMTGEKEDGYLFGISDLWKEELRKYPTFHEFVEFNEIGVDTEGRCVSALEKELKIVPKEFRKEYMAIRRDFFKTLIDYASKLPQKYTKSDLEEFEGSLDRLKEMN